MQKTFLKILSATLATAVLAHAQDSEPDLKKEKNFHRIYKTYNQQPTSVEAWEKVLSGRQANSYSVQSKDTLWDISNTLFGESTYWPKVWSYNTDDILNPHEISPNQVIKFYPGTLSEAPTVGLADKSAPAEDLPAQILEKNTAGELESIKIPPPKRKSRPLVKKLPESLPLYRLGQVNRPPLDFEVSGARVKYVPAQKYLSHYVVDKPVEGLGEIVEMEYEGAQSSGEFENIVVRVSNAANRRFVVVKDDLKISDPNAIFGNKGVVLEVQGEIELRERVNEGENLFRAVVTKSIQPLELGAKLIAGNVQTFESDATTVSTAVQSNIIGGEFHRVDQNMFSTDNIVFLNAGAKEGLQVGSTLNVFQNERIRKAKTGAITNDRVIGQVKIIHLSEHFATGYIVDATSDIVIGDYAGGSVKAAVSVEDPAAPEASSAAVSDGLDGLDSPPPANGENNGGSGDDLDFEAPQNSEAPEDEELQL